MTHVYIYQGSSQRNEDGTYLIDGQIVYQSGLNSYDYYDFGYWYKGKWTAFALESNNPNGVFVQGNGGSGTLYSITTMNYRVWGSSWRSPKSGGAFYSLRGGASLTDGYGNYKYLGSSDKIVFGTYGSYNQGNTLGSNREWVQCYGYYNAYNHYTDLDYWYIKIDDKNTAVSNYSINTY